MQKAYPLFLFLVLLAAAGCEKQIDMNLREQEEMLVVEGVIEDNRFPMVILTKNLGFQARITPGQLEASFVHDAKVTVSDGARTHQLREYRIDTTGDAAIYFYSVDTAQLATAFLGERSVSYTLTIESEGKTYHAITSIPDETLKLDSIWWRALASDDTLAGLMIRVSDPPERGNYVRYFTARNQENFLAGFNSVFDDQIVNGTTFDVPLDAGVDRTQAVDFETYGFFRRGDTVTLKFCNVDHDTYSFWRTADFAFSSGGNPFSTPVRIQGNIKGGALGYWGGYGVTYKTIIIPE